MSINDSGGFIDAIGLFFGVSMTSRSEGNCARVGKLTQLLQALKRVQQQEDSKPAIFHVSSVHVFQRSFSLLVAPG